MNKLDIIKNDFRGFLFKSKKIVLSTINMKISSFFTYVLCNMKDVQLGKNIRFFGVPIIDRVPLSSIKIGKNCTFRSDSTVNLALKKKIIIRTYNNGASIEIGNHLGINASVIAAAEKIVIGNGVLIGFNCYISDTDNHAVDPIMRHTGKPETAPIFIEDNVWLGVNVVVLKGVRIGKNSVIGANSVVLSNIPENVVAIGNPCRVIKKI